MSLFPVITGRTVFSASRRRHYQSSASLLSRSNNDVVDIGQRLRAYLAKQLAEKPEGHCHDPYLATLEPIEQRLSQLLDDQKDLESILYEPGELGQMAKTDLAANSEELNQVVTQASRVLLPENQASLKHKTHKQFIFQIFISREDNCLFSFSFKTLAFK